MNTQYILDINCPWITLYVVISQLHINIFIYKLFQAQYWIFYWLTIST